MARKVKALTEKPAELATPKPVETPTPRKKRRSRPTVAQVGPHPVDIHVGSRVRLARLLGGKTQQWLAQQVQLTFQQVQKYERGANRISCSMLVSSSSVATPDRTITGTASAKVCSHSRFSGPRK